MAFKTDGFTLYARTVRTKSGPDSAVYFFAKRKPENAEAVELPDGYGVVVGDSGLPTLEPGKTGGNGSGRAKSTRKKSAPKSPSKKPSGAKKAASKGGTRGKSATSPKKPAPEDGPTARRSARARSRESRGSGAD